MCRSILSIFATMLIVPVGMAAGQTTQPATSPVQHLAAGEIARIDGRDVVVKTPAGEVVVPTDEHSHFRVDGAPATFDSLTLRMRVQARRLQARDNHPPRVLINALSPELGGKIVEISDNEILLRQRINSQKHVDVPVSFDQATEIMINERIDGKLRTRIGTMNDLRPGMFIWVRPDTGTAKSIVTLPQQDSKPEINPEL